MGLSRTRWPLSGWQLGKCLQGSKESFSVGAIGQDRRQKATKTASLGGVANVLALGGSEACVGVEKAYLTTL